MFEYVLFSFSPLGTLRDIRRLDGLQRFLDYFSVKIMKISFRKTYKSSSENKFRFDCSLHNPVQNI